MDRENRYGSYFVESEALLALTADDLEYAQAMVEDMSSTETKILLKALDVYRGMLHDRLIECINVRLFPTVAFGRLIADLRRFVKDETD